jgi:TetR/AcrR family transcriptional regulator, copper-responsive repressor
MVQNNVISVGPRMLLLRVCRPDARIEMFGRSDDIAAMGRPKQFTRKDVLQKALPVFWKQGFARASLPEVEHATGVNKSGLYAEFESKEKLYLECLKFYLDGRDGADFLAAEPLGWDNIQRFLEEGSSRARGQRGCFAVSSMRELECLPREARNVIAAGRQKISELLMRNVRVENPRMDAAAVCGLISVFFSGISIEANLNLDPSVACEKVANFMKMLRGL